MTSPDPYMKGDDVGWKNMVMPLGQHGGIGGTEWDDGVFSAIKQVEIACDDERIVSIRTEYCDDNGNSTWSDKHGGNHVRPVGKIVLDYPVEYLISIHGYMGNDRDGHYVIRSLTLESNQKRHGPFGVERGKRFWFPTTGSKVVGFHGSCDWLLHSIGIKVVPSST